MRLLEVFLLMELRDRLAHIAQTMGKKILARWVQHMVAHAFGTAGLPREWKAALHNETLPDPVNNDNWTKERATTAVEWIVEWFSQFDPTPNKKYTDWMVRQWLTEKIYLEDVSKLRTILETFEEHKNNLGKIDISSGDEDYRNDRAGAPVPPPERRGDLNSWKDYRVLANVLRPLTGTQAAGEKVSNFLKKPEIQDYMHHPVPDPVKAFGPEGDFDFDELRADYVDEYGDDIFDTMDWYDTMDSYDIGGYRSAVGATVAIKPIYKSDRLAVLQPNTRAAACELGKGTEWCTSSTESENYFWNYAPDGPLYVILTDKMGKFQFHFDSSQFADIHDDKLGPEQKEKLVQAYPELTEIFGDQAVEYNQMWLVDGSKWDIDKVNDYINSEKFDANTRKSDIKLWDGVAPEEIIVALEKWIREESPHDAYEFVRKPTAADHTKAIVHLLRGSNHAVAHQRSPAVQRILRQARDNGIKLPDEAIELAIRADSRSIKHASIEQLKRNPDWVIDASENDPTWLKIAAGHVNGYSSDWIPADGRYLADPTKEFIMKVFRDHPEGRATLNSLIKQEPKLVRYCLDYFGTDLWKLAYAYANDEHNRYLPSGNSTNIPTKNNNMEPMADALRWHQMPKLDHAGLATYLLQNGILHIATFQAIEHVLGALPIEIQKALISKSPTFIYYIENPDPQVKQEAMTVMPQGAKEFGDVDVRKANWSTAQALKNFEKHNRLDMNDDPPANDHPVARALLRNSTSFNEGVSPILYHVSSISNVLNMLTDNAIRLTPDFGTPAEKEHQPEGKIYYLSTARSKTGTYGYPVSKHQKHGAMVVLDGQSLMSAGYTGKAIDYWGPEYRKLGRDEMEDRIFSKKPAIPNASKYIKEIHILFDKDEKDSRSELVARVLKDLGYKAKRLDIPLYIYDDQEAFALQDKRKAIPLTDVSASVDKLPLPDTDVEPRERGYYSRQPKNYFGGWMELLKVNDKSQLSDAGKKALYKAHYHDASLSVDADIHNARTNNERPYLDRFIAAMQQLNIKNTQELMDYVNQKFN